MVKDKTYNEELSCIMNGSLGCDNDNLLWHLKYINKRITNLIPFINEVKEKKIGVPSILDVVDQFETEVKFYNTFIDWCNANRGLVLS